MINGRKLIALCTSRVYDPQIHGYIVRLNERLKKEGYALLIFAINSDIYWEEDRQATERYIFDLIPYAFLDGIIIMDEKIKSHKIAKKIIGHAHESDVPVVIADGRYDGVSCITYDYESGFEKVVRHVIEDHGIRDVHIMAGHPNNKFSDSRIAVFKKVLKENGISFDRNMVSYGHFWAEPCRKATRALLSRGRLPKAIICANDIMAITVTEMLIEDGYKVPDDVIVSGFDGYDEIYFTSPKITTASCDILALADVSADTILKAIATGGCYDESIMPTFIANESCGCPEHSEHPQILRDWFKESFARNNDDNRVLQLITTSMQTSSSPGELVLPLRSYKTDNVLAVVDRKCFDESVNYFTDTESEDQQKELIIIYDADFPEQYNTDTLDITGDYEFTEDVLSPSVRNRILELTESGYPIIFNSLDYMMRPFGFVCYYYRDYFISNYTNTMGVTNAISIGVGGYVNIQYQRMLLYKMDEMYRHDPLTGLYNRIGFQNDFKKLRKHPKNYKKIATVIMTDLDGLKYINDNFGHAEGDRSIKAVADALFSAVPDNSISTRFGGDEVFSVIFGECDQEKIMQDIDSYLNEYNSKSDKPYDVTTSSGYMTAILDDDFDIAQAIKLADEAMYKNKNRKYEERGQKRD